MIIRKIRPEEIKRTQELFAIAFEFGEDISRTAEEISEEVLHAPKSREEVYWQERWAAFEDDDRTMMSYFIAQPFPVHFDGNTYSMTGIGGVASLPQYRRRGCIRSCFEAALPAMYQDGRAFSYLYPFSTSYYRKFGYEMGCGRIRCHVRLNSLKYFDVSGSCSLVEPGNLMLEDIRHIYEVWQGTYNMMIVNESYEYNWVSKSNPVKDQLFTYVYKSGDGTPMGYVSLKQAHEEDGRNLYCTRFCFTGPEGLKGLLNVLLALGSDHSFATFELPEDVDLALVLAEWSMGAAGMVKEYAGMVRVINVEKVLTGARYRGSGSLAIEIADRQIPENCGCFAVEFDGGKAVKVAKDTGRMADISMGINEFSRLITGACDTASLPYMDKVTVHSDLDRISQVFYKKPAYILEYF